MTQQAPAALLHAHDALVPARDDHARAERERERLAAAVPGGVELRAVREQHADVLDVDGLAGGRLRALAHLEVLVDAGRSAGRRPWGP